MLCEAAHHARRPEHPLNPYFAALCARRGYKMATIAVAHRLCRILFAMLRDRTEFDPQQLAIEEAPSPGRRRAATVERPSAEFPRRNPMVCPSANSP